MHHYLPVTRIWRMWWWCRINFVVECHSLLPAVSLSSSCSSDGRCMAIPFEKFLLRSLCCDVLLDWWYASDLVSWEELPLTALFSTFCCRNRSFFWQILSGVSSPVHMRSFSSSVRTFYCQLQQKSILYNSTLPSVYSNFFFSEYSKKYLQWNSQGIICIVLKFSPSAIMNIFCIIVFIIPLAI